MQRVLYVESGSGYGGSMVSLARILACVDRTRVEPIVVLDQAGASEELLKGRGIQVIRMSRPGGRLFRTLAEASALSRVAYPVELIVVVVPHAIRLAWLMLRRRIDVVHINNHLESGLAGILAAHLCRVPCVVHLRNVRKLRWTERVSAPLVKRFSVLSEMSREVYRQQGVPGERISVLHDPIQDVTDVDGRVPTRASLGIPQDVPAVGMFSRLVAGKGHEDFLHAASRVHGRFPQARFLIMGKEDVQNGPITRQLGRLVGELGLEAFVTFTGWRSDVPRVISALDVVVDASQLHEGTRLTVLEAMAMGKPVIATTVGAEAEFFEGGCGVLVAPGRPEQLAEAICALLDDPEGARRMGEAARERVLRLCDPQRSARSLEAVYDAVLERNYRVNSR